MSETNKMTHEQMNELLRQQDAGLATLRKHLAEAEAELKKCADAVMTYVETVKRKNREIWAAEADCAAMREALDFYAENVGNCARFSDETGNVARARLAKDIGEKARAALTTRPTGQAILDELSAARKLIKELRTFPMPIPTIAALDAYDAARKANT